MGRFADDWKRWFSAAARDGATSQRLQIPRERNGRPAFGMLTGQDHRTLAAFAALWDLYAASDELGQRGALQAARAILPGLQEKCHPFARELVARSLDWADRERIWRLMTMPVAEFKAKVLAGRL